MADKEYLIDHLPRFHDFIAEGIPEHLAMKWHEAISALESHALTITKSIRKSALSAETFERYYRKQYDESN